MTNFKLYGRIIYMKKLSSFKNIITSLGLVACACFALYGFNGIDFANAERLQERVSFIPSTQAQQFDFTTYSAKDAVSFNGGYALIREDQTLWIYTEDNGYVQYDKLVRGNPTLMKVTADNRLIYSDDTALFIIDLNDLDKEPVEIQFQGSQILCTYFDFNDTHLVTINGNTVILYPLDNLQVSSSPSIITTKADTLTPVCIDPHNNVYFIANSSVHYYNTSNDTLEDIYGFTSKPSVLAAHGKYVYFTEGSQIKRLSPDKEMVTLIPPVDERFDLGNLISPTNLSFNDENMLVCDSIIGAVQEFSIDGDNLVFTGFAIAKNKTAFNRIDIDATEVDRYQDHVAVLSSERVMIINQGSDYDYFSRNSFVNLFEEDFEGVMPTDLALGDKQLVTVTSRTIKLYDFSTRTPFFTSSFSLDGTITDVCYQSGYFYLLANYSDSYSKVFKFTAEDMLRQDFNVTDFRCSAEDYSYSAPHQFALAVNVFGEIYTQDLATKKIESDLVGNFYLLKSDGFHLYNPSTEQTTLVKEMADVTSFTINFDKQVCHVLQAESELLYGLNDLGNKAIDSIVLPDDFKTTSHTTDGNLTAYTVDSGNIYVVDTSGETLGFTKLASAEKHYLYVCDIPELNLNVLLAQQGVVLVDKGGLTQCNLGKEIIQKTAYVATDVNGYYFPIITRDDSYTLKSIAPLTNVRLVKGTTIQTEYKIEILDIEYYLATFRVGNAEHKGFVPVNFTTLSPVSVTNFSLFTYHKTSSAKVYSDQALTTEAFTLEKGDTVRVFETIDGVTRIQYLKNEIWLDGYVDSQVVQTSNKIIRNVLIILATLACVCGSATYFLIRKKKNN